MDNAVPMLLDFIGGIVRFAPSDTCSVRAVAAAAPPPAIGAPAYLLVDLSSGQGIVGEAADERREPASLTKLMTAYLAFAALRDKAITPAQMVPVSKAAWHAQGSRMFIEPRKAVSVDELLRGTIVQSGNDSSIALAERLPNASARPRPPPPSTFPRLCRRSLRRTSRRAPPRRSPRACSPDR